LSVILSSVILSSVVLSRVVLSRVVLSSVILLSVVLSRLECRCIGKRPTESKISSLLCTLSLELIHTWTELFSRSQEKVGLSRPLRRSASLIASTLKDAPPFWIVGREGIFRDTLPLAQVTEHLRVQKVGWRAGGILAVSLIQRPHHPPLGCPQNLKKLSPKKG
jgi:hypothetical protein